MESGIKPWLWKHLPSQDNQHLTPNFSIQDKRFDSYRGMAVLFHDANSWNKPRTRPAEADFVPFSLDSKGNWAAAETHSFVYFYITKRIFSQNYLWKAFVPLRLVVNIRHVLQSTNRQVWIKRRFLKYLQIWFVFEFFAVFVG